MGNDMNFCPSCGGRNIRNEHDRKWGCPDCGYRLYNNVAAAVGLVIEDADGRILFERRAKEPRRGFLAFPGGFVDPDETAEEAAARECLEETGASPATLEYIASFPNTYEYKGIVYKTCDLFFRATLPEGASLRAEAGEVLAFEARSVRNRAELDALDLAFVSARRTLELWLSKRGGE